MLFFNVLLLLLSNGLTVRRDVSLFYSRVSILILMYTIFSAYITYFPTYFGQGLGLYNGLFIVTGISHIFHIFIFIITFTIINLTCFYPRKTKNYKKSYNRVASLLANKLSEQFIVNEYPLIILFVIIGGTLILSCQDFISLFLCIELQSYGLYILCVIYRNSEPATNSGLTYFLLGGLSSCFILLSIVFIYINTATFNLDNFYLLTNLSFNIELNSLYYNYNYLVFALTVLSSGLLFKIAAAPFHFWSPDVYDGIPTLVTTFVAIIAKISILIFMLDLVHYTSDSLTKTTYDWITCVIISSFLSMIIGTILGLTQTRIKRLLAYSTISHLGFILLALAVNTIESSKAFIFYLMQYSITNLEAFIILISIGFSIYVYINNNYEVNKLKDKDNSPIQLISQLKGLFNIYSYVSISLAIVMLSFVGLPPVLGFFAKQMVLTSALDKGFIFSVIIAIITSVIGAVYYLNIIKTIFFDINEYKNLNLSISIITSSHLNFLISLITLILIFFIFTPNEILNLSNILSIISFTNNVYF